VPLSLAPEGDAAMAQAARPVLGAAASVGGLLSSLRTPLYRNGYALVLSSAASSGLGFVYWTLAARSYPVDVVGLNSAVISAMLFVAGVSHLDLGSMLLRFIPRAGRATPRLVGAAYVINALVTAAVGCGLLLGIRAWFPAFAFLSASTTLGPLFVAATVVWSIFGLQDDVLTGLRQAKWVLVKNVMFSVTKIGLVVVLAQGFSEYGIFASWTIPVLVSIIPIILLTFSRLIPRSVGLMDQVGVVPGCVELAKYSAGNFIGTLFYVASTTLLPVIIAQSAGSAAAAYFYLAWIIGSTLQLVTANMANVLTVEATIDQARLDAYCLEVVRHLAMVLIPIVMVLILIAPYLLQVFGRSYATQSAALLRLLVFSSLPGIFTAVYIAAARVRRRVRDVAVVQATLTTLVLGLSYLLLPTIGITGVGLAWLISQSLLAAVVATLTVMRWARTPAGVRGSLYARVGEP
jgi:O-antigen/teichoic acid export membrane protein